MQNIMGYIPVSKIYFAFDSNVIDFNKVEEYAKEMAKNDRLTGHYGFPEIWGYADVLNQDDVDFFEIGDFKRKSR